MRAIRIIGWILLALAFFFAGGDIVVSMAEGKAETTSLGELWFSISPANLNLVQAVIERYLHPWLWDPVIVSLLFLPVALLIAIPGLALVLFCRPPPPKRFA